MIEGDRIARLEERVAALEEAVGHTAGQRGSGAGGDIRAEVPKAATTRPQIVTPAGHGAAPLPRRPAAIPPRSPAAALLSSEQWIGQRVLLAVGVVALILAAGYLLRLSFDRGWISPVMRALGVS